MRWLLNAITRMCHDLWRLNNLVLALFAVAGIIGIVLIGASNTFSLIGLKEGEKAPAVVLKDINGSTMNLSDTYGKKPLIIIFWELTANEAFINYSKEELRFMNEYYRRYHDKYGLEIAGIYTPVEENKITEKELESVRKIVAEEEIGFPILIDRGFNTFRDFGVIALPSTVMLSKSGKAYFIYPSFPVLARQIFGEKVDELIGIRRPREVLEAEHKAEAVKRSERLYRYALRLFKKGAVKQTVSPLKKSIALDPDFSQSRNLMGIVLWMNGRERDAEKEFAAAFEIDNKNMGSLFNLGLIHLDGGRLDEAEKYFKKVITGEQYPAQAHYMIGIISARRGDYGAAERNLNTARKILKSDMEKGKSPNYVRKLEVSILYALSSIKNLSGDKSEALNLLGNAFLLNFGAASGNDNFVYRKTREFVIHE